MMDPIHSAQTNHWLQWSSSILPKNDLYKQALAFLAEVAEASWTDISQPLGGLNCLTAAKISYISAARLQTLWGSETAKNTEALEKILLSLTVDDLRVLDLDELLNYLAKTNQIEVVYKVMQKVNPSEAKRLLRSVFLIFAPKQCLGIIENLNFEKLKEVLTNDLPEPYVWPIFREAVAWHEQKLMTCDFTLSNPPSTLSIPNALRELHEKYLNELQKLENQALKDRNTEALVKVRLERKRYFNESIDQLGKSRAPSTIDHEIEHALKTKNVDKVEKLVRERLQYCLSDPVNKRSRKRDVIWSEWEPLVRQRIESRALWEEALTCLLKDQLEAIPNFDDALPINAKIAYMSKLYRQKELTGYIIQLRTWRIKNQQLLYPRRNDADLFEERAFKIFTRLSVSPVCSSQIKDKITKFLRQFTRDQAQAKILEKIYSSVADNAQSAQELEVLSIKRLNCQDAGFINLIQEILEEKVPEEEIVELTALAEQHQKLANEATPLLIALGWGGQVAFLEAAKVAIDNWQVAPKDFMALLNALYTDYEDWKKRYSYATEPEPPFEKIEIERMQKNFETWLSEMLHRLENKITQIKEAARLPFLSTDALRQQLHLEIEKLKGDELEKKYVLLGKYFRVMEDHISHLKFQHDVGTLTVDILKHSIHSESSIFEKLLSLDPSLDPVARAIRFRKELEDEMSKVHDMMHLPNLRKLEIVEIDQSEPELYFLDRLNSVYQIRTIEDLKKLGFSEWSDIPKFMSSNPNFFRAFLEFEKVGNVKGFLQFMQQFNL